MLLLRRRLGHVVALRLPPGTAGSARQAAEIAIRDGADRVILLLSLLPLSEMGLRLGPLRFPPFGLSAFFMPKD